MGATWEITCVHNAGVINKVGFKYEFTKITAITKIDQFSDKDQM